MLVLLLLLLCVCFKDGQQPNPPFSKQLNSKLEQLTCDGANIRQASVARELSTNDSAFFLSLSTVSGLSLKKRVWKSNKTTINFQYFSLLLSGPLKPIPSVYKMLVKLLHTFKCIHIIAAFYFYILNYALVYLFIKITTFIPLLLFH